MRGKPLNARDAPVTQIRDNKELTDLVATLGLDFAKTYASVRSALLDVMLILSVC